MTNEYLEHTVTMTIPGIVTQEGIRLAREVSHEGISDEVAPQKFVQK